MSRRSLITKYEFLKATIFEYKDDFFVIRECQQGQRFYEEQLASDYSGLYLKLPRNCSSIELGTAVMDAIDAFDTEPTPFDQFDIPAKNRCVKKWIGYRGIKEWERNQRVVDGYKVVANGTYIIRPYDNHNINPWIGPQNMPELTLDANVSAKELGDAVLKAFEMATYNPAR